MKKINKMTLKSSWYPKCGLRTLAALCLLPGFSLVILGQLPSWQPMGEGLRPSSWESAVLGDNPVSNGMGWGGRGTHFRAGQEPGFRDQTCQSAT